MGVASGTSTTDEWFNFLRALYATYFGKRGGLLVATLFYLLISIACVRFLFDVIPEPPFSGSGD